MKPIAAICGALLMLLLVAGLSGCQTCVERAPGHDGWTTDYLPQSHYDPYSGEVITIYNYQPVYRHIQGECLRYSEG